MSQQGSTSTDAQLVGRLKSGDSSLIIETIEKLRHSGTLGYMDLIFDLLKSNVDHEVRGKILNLLADIRSKEFVPIIMQAIQDERNLSIRKELVAVCWENKLDFSGYTPVFVDLTINGNFEVSLEAYTVITNFEGLPTSDVIVSESEKIKEALDHVSHDRKQLLGDILDYFTTYN